MTSKDLAETIIRAEKIASLVKQIDSLNFAISSEENPKEIYIINGKGESLKENPLVSISDINIPEELKGDINLKDICTILNDELEIAKFNIIRKIQISIFNSMESDDSPDGFIEIGEKK